MASNLVLSDKERARLAAVRKALNEGTNPYANTSKLTLGDGTKDKKVSSVKEVSPKVRLAKFNARKPNSHKWKFNDGIDPDHVVVTGPKCIGCNEGINSLTSVYSRILTNVVKTVESTQVLGVEKRRTIAFPVFKTGYACKKCFDTLYTETYHDLEGNLHRGIEAIHKPSSETSSKPVSNNAFMGLERERSKPKRVTEVLLNKGGEVEEWVVKLPPEAKEVADPKSYNKIFHRGRKYGKADPAFTSRVEFGKGKR